MQPLSPIYHRFTVACIAITQRADYLDETPKYR